MYLTLGPVRIALHRNSMRSLHEPVISAAATFAQRRYRIRLYERCFSHCAQLLAAMIFLFQCVSVSYAETPEYLSEPIDEKAAEPYRNLLKEKLLTSQGNFGAMILMPTGRGEWAVSASAVKRGQSKSSVFRLSLTLATANLYESKLGTDRKDIDVPIREIPVIIDKEFALAIRRAWRAILSKDPFPQSDDEFAMVLDGYSADFSVKMPDGRVVTRRTLSPQASPAADIVTLGYELRDYCESTVDQRKRKRHDIVEKLDRFSEQLERKHNARVESHVLDLDGGRAKAEKIAHEYNGFNAGRDR